MDSKKIKSVIKGVITFIPGVSFILKERKKKTEHSGLKAEFAYSLWMSTLVFLKEQKQTRTLEVIGEVGNGGSLGIAFCALLTGSKKYYSYELAEMISIEKQLRLLNDIVEFFINKKSIPIDDKININIKDRSFPEELVLSADELLKTADRLREELLGKSKKENTIIIVKNWQQEDNIKLDFIFSRAVMEHVKNPENVYRSLYNLLYSGGLMLHDIEMHSHGLTESINGHFKIHKLIWYIIYGNRPFFLNRWTTEKHIDTLSKLGFNILTVNKQYKYIGKDNLSNVLFGITILAQKN